MKIGESRGGEGERKKGGAGEFEEEETNWNFGHFFQYF